MMFTSELKNMKRHQNKHIIKDRTTFWVNRYHAVMRQSRDLVCRIVLTEVQNSIYIEFIGCEKYRK